MDERTFRLGDLQLAMMKVLWRHGPASVADVHARLPGGLAYTTVATMLRKMEDRRLVEHTAEGAERGRRFIYRAAVTADDVTRSMADDLVDRLFDGNLATAVEHLLEARDVSEDELANLERLIRHHKRGKRK